LVIWATLSGRGLADLSAKASHGRAAIALVAPGQCCFSDNKKSAPE
jgi:hypothetical protein